MIEWNGVKLRNMTYEQVCDVVGKSKYASQVTLVLARRTTDAPDYADADPDSGDLFFVKKTCCVSRLAPFRTIGALFQLSCSQHCSWLSCIATYASWCVDDCEHSKVYTTDLF